MNKPACICGAALGVIVIAGHLCPVHHERSFFLGQHPLEEAARPEATDSPLAWIASGGDVTVALTGVEATGKVGTVTPSVTVALVHENVTTADEADGVIRVNLSRL